MSRGSGVLENDTSPVFVGSPGSSGLESKYDRPCAADSSEFVLPPTGSTKDPYCGKQFRWWFFTWNNPAHPGDKDVLLASKFTYLKFQYERGKDGTLHYQGVFYCSSKIGFRAIVRRIGNPGYLAPVKSIDSAVNYCGKDETRVDGPWVLGKLPQQGERTDLQAVKDVIDGGGNMTDVFETNFGAAVRYHRGFQVYYNIVQKNNVRTWQTVCYVYYGDAGTGKTEAAKEESRVFGGGTYWLTVERGNGGKVWWDGYDGEENIIIDEFNCQIPFSEFKRLIDSSPLQVAVKGGHVNFRGKRIWILSNQMLDAWYYRVAPPGPMRNSLLRRLHYVECFLEKFQGQPDYESFLFLRSQFVVAQRAGEIVIKTT